MQETLKPHYPNKLTKWMGRIKEFLQLNREKEQRIANITNAINERLNTTDRLTQYKDIVGYPVQNDYGLSESYDEALGKIEKSKELRVAVIVGNGAAISHFPEFAKNGIDLVIHLDISPSVLKFVEDERTAVAQAKNTAIFTKESLVQLTDQRTASEYQESLLPFMIGNRHYSSSVERLKAIQKAAQKVKTTTALVNFFSPEDMGLLGSILSENNAKVVMINSTNVWDHQPEGKSTSDNIKTLQLLPLQSDCQIIYADGGSPGPSGSGAVAMRPTTSDTLEDQLAKMSGYDAVWSRRDELDELHNAEIVAYNDTQDSIGSIDLTIQ